MNTNTEKPVDLQLAKSKLLAMVVRELIAVADDSNLPCPILELPDRRISTWKDFFNATFKNFDLWTWRVIYGSISNIFSKANRDINFDDIIRYTWDIESVAEGSDCGVFDQTISSEKIRKLIREVQPSVANTLQNFLFENHPDMQTRCSTPGALYFSERYNFFQAQNKIEEKKNINDRSQTFK
uniref:Uncharacterized protein n=1 Tax=uncultured bacterium A1Q1_fos_2140 TaxID=1256565 RepID=L7VWD5_9BACT|nr:hypothetical protein [uncultured bacterium A1Q1_fos_2140]